MNPALNLLGKRFGRLTVIEQAESSAAGRARWLCRCDCGAMHVALAHNLRTGDIKSCGCGRKAQAEKRARDLTITAALREQSAERRKSGKASSVQRQTLDAAWDEIRRNYVPPRGAAEYWQREGMR